MGPPPYLYSGYQDSPVLVLVTWDQIGNRPNLLETFCDKKKFLWGWSLFSEQLAAPNPAVDSPTVLDRWIGGNLW